MGTGRARVSGTSRWIDLHLHSTASDGQLSPARLVEEACRRGLAAIALTDHDTTAGLAEAAGKAEAVGLEAVAGIELSVRYDPGVMHLLGYWIDPAEAGLGRVCQKLVRARAARNPQIVARLVELGCPISMEQVRDLAGDGVIGRPHIARAMVAAGCARTVKQVFARYLAKGAAAYVPREKLSAAEAIAAIHGAGGIAALAHPAQLGCRTRTELDPLVGGLAGLGIEAIEVHHPDHRPEQTRAYMELAGRYGLVMVGGSDFHGPAESSARRVGFCSLRIPYEWLEQLRARLAARRGRETVAG